jgi:SPP1 gp7 family putative phage head morphogenesis protein
VAYNKRLLKDITKPVWKDINGILVPALERLEPTYSKSYLANSAEDEVQRIIKELVAKWGDIGDTATNLSTRWADENQEFHRGKFIEYLSGVSGVDISEVLTDAALKENLQQAVSSNVNLIKTIPEVDLKRVEKAMLEGIYKGDNLRSLKKELQEISEMSFRRARTIARDQTSKLNGSLNNIRQVDVGIKGYFWRTTGNKTRVRESHWKKRGKRFLWSSPPSDTGHPGEDINCRCFADPDLRALRLP